MSEFILYEIRYDEDKFTTLKVEILSEKLVRLTYEGKVPYPEDVKSILERNFKRDEVKINWTIQNSELEKWKISEKEVVYRVSFFGKHMIGFQKVKQENTFYKLRFCFGRILDPNMIIGFIEFALPELRKNCGKWKLKERTITRDGEEVDLIEDTTEATTEGAFKSLLRKFLTRLLGK